SEGDARRLAELVTELVDLPVDVLVLADTQSIPLVQKATATVPVVMSIVFDPVGSGVADSLRRPGRNFTGFRVEERQWLGKRMECLNELVPSLTRVAVLVRAGVPWGQRWWGDAQAAAEQLGFEPFPAWVDQLSELAAVVQGAVEAGAQAL